VVLPQYGYSIRQGQIELAGEMLSALKKCKISLSEAGVGLGKTHGYIIASILNNLDNKNFNRIRVSYPLNEEFHKMTKMPTVISTSSIALQKAIAYDYIPEISKILMKSGLIKKPLSSVIRKGKDHYACDKRLMDYITGCAGNNGNTVQDNHDEEYLLKEIQNAGFLDIDLSKYDKLRSYTKSRINVSIQCNAKYSCYNSCRYQKLIKHTKSYQHDFQICNHNYFLADIRHRSRGVAPLIPNYQAVIIDEAHKFLGAARQMYGNTISKDDIPCKLFSVKFTFLLKCQQ
jgi:ATP-dependent DNA helicase DinG